jgi:AbrB family looped-hinge helix DNA binding protein
MTTKLSSKGQVVLPKQARDRLGLLPGSELTCEVVDDALVLRPVHAQHENPKFITDPISGLTVTAATGKRVTSKQVRALLADFP